MKLKTALFLSGIVAVSGCGGSGDDSNPPPSYTAPGNQTAVDPSAGISDSTPYNDIGVHDPSIVKVDGTYYVFGSHMAAAKSTDLMGWEYISNSVSDTPLFNTYQMASFGFITIIVVRTIQTLQNLMKCVGTVHIWV